MPQKILFTSFDTWQPDQTSNSSDDLLETLIQRSLFDENCCFLRNVIVDFQAAPERVISAIEQLHPSLIICCGMAEKRTGLSIESNGKFQGETLETMFNLERLIEGTTVTQVSQDAGNFVCNHLYYCVLKHIRETTLESRCLFVHVPLLNEENLEAIVHDFLILIQRVMLK